MMISSVVDKNKKIIFAKYLDKVTLGDIEEFYREIAKKYHHWGTLKMIQDELEAEFEGTTEIMRNAKRLIQILTDSFKSFQVAVVQDRPVETAFSFLFLEHSPKRNYQFKVFSSEDNARAWINA